MCRLTLAIFLFLSIAGPTAAQAPTRQPVSPPPVLVEPHGSDEVSGRFDAAGGKLELKAEDGTLYVLIIPPRALMGPETIAMRSIRSVKGLPGKPKLVGGIDFAPKGLEFLRDATLTVTPKRPLPKGNVPMMWNYEGDGARPWLVAHKRVGTGYVRPISHFSGTMIVGESFETLRDAVYQKALDSATEAASNAFEAEAIRKNDEAIEDIRATLEAERNARRLEKELAKDFADAHRCAVTGGTNCGDGIQEKLVKHRADAIKGILEPAFQKLGQPGATCKQAQEAMRQDSTYELGWLTKGVQDDKDQLLSSSVRIPVSIDGATVAMNGFQITNHLCKKEAVERCKARGDISGMISALRAAERLAQFSGQSDRTSGEILRDAIGFLDCTDELAKRCFAAGDAEPLVKLTQAAQFAMSFADLKGNEPELEQLRAGFKAIEEILTRCARYKVVWRSNTRHLFKGSDGSVQENVTRGEFEATLAYKPSATAEVGGSIHGEGEARFPVCNTRLVRTTDFLSTAYLTPCKPRGAFEAELKNMFIRRAARPSHVELRGSIPVADVRWQQCWRYRGCSEHDLVAGGVAIIVTYQHVKSTGVESPMVGALAGMIIVRNLKERAYPVIFGGTVRAHAKILEGDFDDESEITIEHIGKQ